MKTKRECAAEITKGLDRLHKELATRKLTPAQHAIALQKFYSDMQKKSGYADGAFAQIWKIGCKNHNLATFGITLP